MIRRLLTVSSLLVALVLAAFASSAAALADPYPPASPGAVLSASAYDPCAGASNILGGDGFQPGETIVLTLAKTGEIGRAVADVNGSWQITVTIPVSERGSDQVTATGQTSGLSAGTTLLFPCVVDGSDAAAATAGTTQVTSDQGTGSAGAQNAATRTVGSGTLAYTGAVVGVALLAGLALLVGGVALVVAGRRRRTSITN